MIKKILLSALLAFFITACATTPKDTADTSGSSVHQVSGYTV